MPIQDRLHGLFHKTAAASAPDVGPDVGPEATVGHWWGDAGLMTRLGRRLIPPAKPRVAPLGPAQAGLVIGHFLLLGRNDRQMRFNGNMSFEALCARYHSADWSRTRFLGLWIGKRLVGVAELAATELDGAPAREIGISLRGPWQHKGLAQQLFQAALEDTVIKEGVPLLLYTRGTNRSMVGLAQRFGGEGEMEDGDYRFVFRPEAGPEAKDAPDPEESGPEKSGPEISGPAGRISSADPARGRAGAA